MALCQAACANFHQRGGLLDSDTPLRGKITYEPFASIKRARKTKSPKVAAWIQPGCYFLRTLLHILVHQVGARMWMALEKRPLHPKYCRHLDPWVSFIWDALHLERLTSNCYPTWNPSWQVPEVDQHTKITAQTHKEISWRVICSIQVKGRQSTAITCQTDV